ncbi:MAG: hypothetical protein IJZ55_06420 [Lachnospiraceae bacterium]|nr:hypothetical protein [Lachnospiraceae bacterium]
MKEIKRTAAYFKFYHRSRMESYFEKMAEKADYTEYSRVRTFFGNHTFVQSGRSGKSAQKRFSRAFLGISYLGDKAAVFVPNMP